MKNLLLILSALCSFSCVPLPDAPEITSAPLTDGGVWVVCEGLWRQNNATLSYIGPTGLTENDVVEQRNHGLRLGDTGSDILIHGDSVYVCVSTSGTIEVFHRRTGIWKGRIRFDSGREPYRIALLNDSSAVCSMINDDCISEVHLRNLSVRVARVPVGPAPEGLCVLGGRIYVANSGLGDLRKTEEGSGTITILEASSMRTVKTLVGLTNAMSCIADKQRNRIWITYRHLISQKDSLGGIVLYDPVADSIVQHIRFSSPKGLVVDPATGFVYVLHGNGIDVYDHASQKRSTLVAHQSGSGNDIWYSLGFRQSDRTLLVGNARSYVTNGAVIALDLEGNRKFEASVGLNPSAFGQ